MAKDKDYDIRRETEATLRKNKTASINQPQYFNHSIVVLINRIPYLQVDVYGINNDTINATLENQHRALSQVFGGVAIGIGLYYTWRRINIAEEDLRLLKKI